MSASSLTGTGGWSFPQQGCCACTHLPAHECGARLGGNGHHQQCLAAVRLWSSRHLPAQALSRVHAFARYEVITTRTLMDMKLAPDSDATAFASSVLPHPGGPYSSTPCGALRPRAAKRAGCLIGCVMAKLSSSRTCTYSLS